MADSRAGCGSSVGRVAQCARPCNPPSTHGYKSAPNERKRTSPSSTSRNHSHPTRARQQPSTVQTHTKKVSRNSLLSMNGRVGANGADCPAPVCLTSSPPRTRATFDPPTCHLHSFPPTSQSHSGPRTEQRTPVSRLSHSLPIARVCDSPGCGALDRRPSQLEPGLRPRPR